MIEILGNVTAAKNAPDYAIALIGVIAVNASDILFWDWPFRIEAIKKTGTPFRVIG